MKHLKHIIVVLFVCSTFHILAQQQFSAKQIIQKSDQILKGVESTTASLTIQTIRPKWSREMKLKTWSKGNHQSMILIISPVKDKGTVFLLKNKEVWNWIPSIERTIKMPPSMMMQNWMGTDFTNDDLIKESSIVDDYTHQLIGDTTIINRACYKIELIPKADAVVVWGKIICFIDKKEFFQLKAEFYDEDDDLVNIMLSSEIKMMGGRNVPSKLEMIPMDKKGHKTVMTYTNITFNAVINDDFFSTQNMKRVK